MKSRRCSFDYLVGDREERGRTALETQRFGSLEVDHELEFGHLLDRQVCRVDALKTALNKALGIGITPEAQARRVAPLLSTTRGLHAFTKTMR